MSSHLFETELDWISVKGALCNISEKWGPFRLNSWKMWNKHEVWWLSLHGSLYWPDSLINPLLISPFLSVQSKRSSSQSTVRFTYCTFKIQNKKITKTRHVITAQCQTDCKHKLEKQRCLFVCFYTSTFQEVRKTTLIWFDRHKFIWAVFTVS